MIKFCFDPCGDATAHDVFAPLMLGEGPGRLVLTDEPYNVRISGNVTGGSHRDFAMASGEMSGPEFLTFNLTWMKAALNHLAEGGLFGTFIDWRGLTTVHAAATQLGLVPIECRCRLGGVVMATRRVIEWRGTPARF